MLHKRGHLAAGAPNRRLIEWFRHPNVIGPVPLPLVEGDRSLIARKDIEDDFPEPMVTCPELDIVQQRATNALAFKFLSHREIVDVGPRMIGEIVFVGIEGDDPARLAVNRRHESLGARFDQEVSVSQVREKSVEDCRVSRRRCLTRMHPRSDPVQERQILGAKWTYGDITAPRLKWEFRRHLGPPGYLGGCRDAFPLQASLRYLDVSLQLDRK